MFFCLTYYLRPWFIVIQIYTYIIVIQSIQKKIFYHYDIEYESYRLEEQFGAFYGTLKERDKKYNPSLIAIPKTEQDVIDIVNLAKKNSARIVIKSGGHNYVGLSSCNNNNCYQIHLKYFNKTRFIRNQNNKITSIFVESGQKLGKLYELLYGEGIAILGGNCEGVGVGGHYQSSSLGIFTGSLGLGMDYIKSIKLINANGKLQIVSLKNNHDLFWAILGGSPGSFGIILEYEFEPIYDNQYPFNYIYKSIYLYRKETFTYILNTTMNLLNDSLLINNHDIGCVYLVLTPIKFYPYYNYYVIQIIITWTGRYNGNIFNKMNLFNKTWYNRILSPFDQTPGILLPGNYNNTYPISWILYENRATSSMITVPKYRYYPQHSSFDTQIFNALLTNTIIYNSWITNIVNKVDKLINDNVNNIFFQLWSLAGINNDIIYKNISYPLRNIILEFDNWILFRNEQNNALQIKQELQDIINGKDVIGDSYQIIKTMAFPDTNYNLNGYNYLINEWKKYFPGKYGETVFNKLIQIKTKNDPDNMFSGPLTIPTLNLLKSYQTHTSCKEKVV